MPATPKKITMRAVVPSEHAEYPDTCPVCLAEAHYKNNWQQPRTPHDSENIGVCEYDNCENVDMREMSLFSQRFVCDDHHKMELATA